MLQLNNFKEMFEQVRYFIKPCILPILAVFSEVFQYLPPVPRTLRVLLTHILIPHLSAKDYLINLSVRKYYEGEYSTNKTKTSNVIQKGKDF